MRMRGDEVSFFFAQSGYVNLKVDRGWCRMNGCGAYAPGDRVRLREREQRASEIARRLSDGYVPRSLVEPSPAPALRARVAGALLLPVLALVEKLWTKRLLARRVRRAQVEGRTPVWGAHFGYAQRLMEQLAPDLLVFGQEFPGSVNAYLTRLAARRGVPTVIIPFALGTTKEMCESLAGNPLHDTEFSLLNRLAAAWFPRWVNDYGTQELLRLPGARILMIEAMGLAPEHPWLPNSSRVDRILTESPAMDRYYRRMRFPESQLRLTGAAADDEMAALRTFRDELRVRLCRKLGIDPARPLLVCAWPTNQFGSRQRAVEFVNYQQVCDAWARALATVRRTSDYNVVIRPHPVTDREFLASVLRPYRLKATEIDTMELVPLADLFVACVSSTLRWAIACGLPAINYDCYDYGYTDFDPARGTFTVKRYSEFERILDQLTGDSAAYAAAAAAQRASAPDWAMHDGRSMERIFAAIDELAAAGPAALPAKA